ncbi:MAG: glycosyltransferase family 39 protein [Isosphaeraceae bacterium]|nr:glycosyltransferase family 39 protein [Isosphaeraceae bacterium]
MIEVEAGDAKGLGPCEQAILVTLLLAAFALRAVCLDQPIVENYVGRQVPTAMVARNLERGSGLLRPQLDTAPLPNLFLVEPPVYAAAAVALRRLTGLPLEPAGRLVSALGLTLGGWGLFGLARRRLGVRSALIAVGALVVFPVTLRYGRAFQPDALMLGTLVAGLRCWDEREAGGRPRWLIAGWLLLATCLALKVVSAYLFVPLVIAILRPPRRGKVALALSALVPALLWYVHAAFLLGEGGGSHASADNGAIWLRTLVPTALFRSATLGHIVRFTVVRAFTPLGFALGLGGLLCAGTADRLWRTWGLAVLAAFAVLAAKLHHEYYWLALAPLAAVGVGRSLDALADRSQCAAIALGAGLVALSAAQSASTWRTPAEWLGLSAAARAVQANVPSDAWIVAPEALLYAADRRGCRLEFPRAAARRAAGEWGEPDLPEGRLALIEFYRAHGARFVADVKGEEAGDPERLALHEAIRARYNVLVDSPGVLLAALTDRTDVPEDADGFPR